MENNEPELEIGNEIFNDLIQYVLLEGVGAILTVCGIIIIMIASIKLIRSNAIPGAKLVFWSILLTILFSLISVAYIYVVEISDTLVLEASLSILLGLLFVGGAYGFLKMANFIVRLNDNTSHDS